MNKKENTRHCDCCGTKIVGGDYEEFDGEILCPSCLERETVLCEHCGTRIWNDDNAGDEHIALCQRCRDDHYVECENCGRVVFADDANYIRGEPYCDRCYSDEDTGSIHDYCYKPTPSFYGDSERFFGVELEIDHGGKYSDKAEALMDIANADHELIYIKSDGSLDDGMEIVTHPMTLKFHKSEMPWKEVMSEAIQLRYRSHKTSTCGLHVHVNRDTFGNTREAQDEAISRVLYFVEHHWNEMLKFSRRTEAQMNQWAARYGYKNSPKEIMEHAKKEGNGRYTCVNLTNWNTVEFRMF
ncbi:MAG: amidoligase family protein, partial [Lachnospiraceae bacterium]|nr:amidoligase family protein [Lachnospiraceae bacterium]